MDISNVYFIPVQKASSENLSEMTKKLFLRLVIENSIILEQNLPIKIHSGQPGNITFIKPENYKDLINYLLIKKIKPYFVETGMVTGPRSKASSHKIVAKQHGFIQIPFVVADGENGNDHEQIKIQSGKHFTSCKIANGLVNKKQILVMSHFKGHCDAGFAASLKMLGIGFASRTGKMHVHCKKEIPDTGTINWSNSDSVYHGNVFCERIAEYTLAAVNHNNYIYMNYAIDMTADCDCDGQVMKPVYKDLGIFASTDPVAIDKACLDMLAKREGKKPFDGSHIFQYAENIGLGSQKYKLIHA